MIKVGIVGLGLIGSSLLKKISKNPDYEVFVCSKSSYFDAFQYTKNSSDELNIVKECDIIFVCCAISKTLDYLNKLNEILPQNAVVVDVCSIKKDLLDKKYNFNFVLSHPMAGTEKTGFSAGFEELFENNKWLYEVENEYLIKIIKDVGAIPVKINMQNHDKYCAEISHFPAILATLLFNITTNTSKTIASSGFRDMTRLAVTNSDLLNKMFEDNVENLTHLLNQTIIEFNNLKNMSSNERIELFNQISEKREKMYDKFGKNIYKI